MPILRSPDGDVVVVPDDQAQRALDVGYKPVTAAEAAPALTAPASDAGGLGGATLAGATGLLSGATVGLSDAAIGALASRGTVRQIREAREAHPYVSGAAETAGAILPAVLTGGESVLAAPTRLVGEAGAAAARAGEAVGLGRIGGAAVGGAAEGAIFGLGGGVSQLSLSDDPLTLERAASVLSSNALFGAGVGSVAGAIGKTAEIGLSKAKSAIDEAILRRSEAKASEAVDSLLAEQAAQPAKIGPDTDLSTLDSAGLKTAREQEVQALRAAQAPERAQFAEDLSAFYSQSAEAKLSKIVTGTGDAEARRAGAALKKADKTLRTITDNKIALAEKPDKALYDLQEQKQALETIRDFIEEEQGQFRYRAQETKAEVERLLNEDKLEGYRRDALQERGRREAVRAETERRLGAKVSADGRFELPEKISVANELAVKDAIARNEELQKAIGKLIADPTSERLAQIEAAQEALGARTAAPKIKPEDGGSALGQIVSAVAPFAGPLGAAASVGTRALGGLRKAADVVSDRAGRAVSSFLGVAEKTAGKVEPYAPVLATKTLRAVSYAPKIARAAQDESSASLPELFRARTDEIKSQVAIAPDGSFQTRPEARARIAAKFDGVRHLDPIGADRLETLATRRLEYLASVIPRRPDAFASKVGGPDLWQPSDLEMRAFARRAEAVENPNGVLARLVHGTITPEDAEAFRAVHPESAADIDQQIAAQLPSLQKSLPYKKRLALSIFSGIPVDPAMHPVVLAVLQASFAADGGVPATSAPVAQPQFGSIKKSAPQPTPGQRVSQGANL